MVAVPTREMEELRRVRAEIATMPMYSCLCIDPHLNFRGSGGGVYSCEVLSGRDVFLLVADVFGDIHGVSS